MQKQIKISHKKFCLSSRLRITYYIYVTFSALQKTDCFAEIVFFDLPFSLPMGFVSGNFPSRGIMLWMQNRKLPESGKVNRK